MSTKVNIEGLSKADVLAALFNASSPAGLGFLQAGYGPQVMTSEQAAELVQPGQDGSTDYPAGFGQTRDRGRIYFDYLHGRPLKLDLTSDVEFDPWGFDRDNGGDGAAQRIIDELRKSNEVNSEAIADSHSRNFDEKAPGAANMAMAFEASEPELAGPLALAVLSEVRRPDLDEEDLPTPPAFDTAKQHLDWSADQALKHFDSDPNKAVVIFLKLVALHPVTQYIPTAAITRHILADGLESKARMEYMMKGFAV